MKMRLPRWSDSSTTEVFFLMGVMPTTNQYLSRLIVVAKLVILGLIVRWLIVTFPKEHWDALVTQEKNWWLLALAFSMVLLAHLISYWRWQVLVNALDVPFTFSRAVQLGFLGTLLNSVSVGAVGGDVFKAIEAARKSESKRSEIVASVLVDRAIGLLGLVLVAGTSLSFATFLSTDMRWIWAGALLLSSLGLLGLGIIVVFGHRFPLNWFAKVPFLGKILYKIARSCLIFQGRPVLVLQVLVSSLMVHSCLTLGCVFISHSLYSECPTVGQHFMTIPPAMAAATLPLTPGGVGIQEMAIQHLFREWPDLPSTYSGFIMASVFRGLLLGVALVGAVYYFLGIGNRSGKPANETSP